MSIVVVHSVVTAVVGAPLRWQKRHRRGDFADAPVAAGERELAGARQ